MQKHADLFHIVMTLYAFGFIASLVFYRSEPPTPSIEMSFTAGSESIVEVEGTIGAAHFEATDNQGGLAAPSLISDEKKI